MTTPQELDQLIDDQWKGNPTTLDSEEGALTAELIALAKQFEHDPQFDSVLAGQFNPPVAPKIRKFPRWQRTIAAVAAVVFGLIFVTLSVPQFRAFAQDIIDDLFPRSEETERTIDDPTIDASDFIRFTTAEDLREGLPFEIKLPTFENDEFTFRPDSGVYMISRNAVFTSYSLSDTDGRDLQIRQQMITDATSSGVFWLSTEDNTIGVNAEIIEVEFGEYTGEFVQGAWVTRDHLTEGAKDFFWRSNFPIYRLRWQDETFLYEIERVSTDPITPEDLVAIAESMMQD